MRPDHYLTLTDAEEALLAYVKYQKAQGNFDKVVILLQTPAVMEIANIINDEDFDAILWLGTPGWNGNPGARRHPRRQDQSLRPPRRLLDERFLHRPHHV